MLLQSVLTSEVSFRCAILCGSIPHLGIVCSDVATNRKKLQPPNQACKQNDTA